MVHQSSSTLALPPDEDRLLPMAVLAARWCCCIEVARRRAEELGIPVVKFNKRAHAVSFNAVLAAEKKVSK
jgi:hypothetical protein